MGDEIFPTHTVINHIPKIFRSIINDLKEIHPPAIREVILNDIYQIQEYDQEDFNLIIDLGANLGTFTIACKYLFPQAKIHAIEPIPNHVKLLKKKHRNNLNITIHQYALGEEGKPHPMTEKGSESAYDPNGKTPTTPISFPHLINIIQKQEGNLNNHKILFKSDIEGSETHFMNEENANIIKNFKHISIETHWQGQKETSHIRKTNNWKTMNDWIIKTLPQHQINYRGSSKGGIATYNCKKQ